MLLVLVQTRTRHSSQCYCWEWSSLKYIWVIIHSFQSHKQRWREVTIGTLDFCIKYLYFRDRKYKLCIQVYIHNRFQNQTLMENWTVSPNVQTAQHKLKWTSKHYGMTTWSWRWHCRTWVYSSFTHSTLYRDMRKQCEGRNLCIEDDFWYLHRRRQFFVFHNVTSTMINYFNYNKMAPLSKL